MKQSLPTTRYIISLALSIGLSGCITVPVVEQATHEKPIALVNMDCSEPYAFKQDCTAWTRAARVLRIDKIDVAVAATEDGSTVLALDAHSFRHMMFGYPLLFNSPLHSKKSNAGYHAVREVLERNGFSILKAIPVKSLADDTSGYVLELNGNGYEVLKAYTHEPCWRVACREAKQSSR